MAKVYENRVAETTTTIGTGTVDLAGAVTGHLTFVAGVGTGNTCAYLITSLDETQYEVGIGTVTDAAPDTLSRGSIQVSSNGGVGGSLVNFSAGTKNVQLVADATEISKIATALQNVVEDTSPQLGGTLDINSQSVQFPTTTITDVLDEDNLASDSATALATQQSIKAYVDAVPSDVVSDTTPQLGGDLDVNGQSIVSVSAGDISITPDTTGSVILDGLNWPQLDGTAGQVLKTDAAGQLSFTDVNSKAQLIDVRNESAATINKGDPVYAVGYDAGTSRVLVSAADAVNGTKMTCIGLATAEILNNANGQVQNWGYLTGLNTSALTASQAVFIASGGGLTSTRPNVAGNIPQRIGECMVTNATTGIILLAVTNARGTLPLLANQMMVGQASGIVVATDQSAINLSVFNDDTGHISNIVEDTTPQLGGTLDINSQSIQFPTTTITDVLDEDNMASDSATSLATQQSIKAYVDGQTYGITDIVSDTTPQLGGPLDVNGQSIVSISAGDIAITPDTTGSVILDGLSWPQGDGGANTFLTTDGAGNLSFGTPSVGSSVDVAIPVRNESGGLITKGTPVYASGWNVGNAITLIDTADADSSATMPAIGLVTADIANNAQGFAITNGNLGGLATDSWSVGNDLWVSGSGTLVNARPTGAALIQKVAVVVRSHVSAGVLFVFGTGTAQNLPNLTLDNIWVGDSDSQPIETPITDYSKVTRTIEADTSTALTLALTNAGNVVTMNNASANVVTIPPNSSVAFAVGTQVDVIMKGAGVTSITGDTGVTVNGVAAGTGAMDGQYKAVTLLKEATDTWLVMGAIGAVA
jgi:hypothetical protein